MAKLTMSIINTLNRGNIRSATQEIGEYYTIEGTVFEGNKLGRTIGTPTANLLLSESDPIHLPHGVYAVFVNHSGKTYPGIANIGVRPTLNLNSLSVEVHLFGFSGDLYGLNLRVAFVDFIRQERKFSGIDSLKNQIIKDIETAKEILRASDHPNTNS
jgi:riboflavin kinase / FMN adenylyltransferase